VALGATGGTYLTIEHVRRSPHAAHYEMMALFAAGGLALSLLLNAAVLRTALRPLARLERAARRVRGGDLGARVRLGALRDPATDRLAAAFNAMLDRLRERTRQVEAYSSRLQELCDRMLLSQEEERARLASRLLDDAGQELATLLLHLRLLQNAAARPGADAAALGRQAAELTEQVRATLDGVRRLAADLRPRLLDDLGLEPAVRSLVREWGERTGIPVDLRASIPPDLHVPPATGIAVYRMTQEALANVAGHAHASRAGVTLAYAGGELVATVEDDGRGVGPGDAGPPPVPGGPTASRPPARLGLFAMQERIGLVGGRLAVESGPERGTTVRAVIPLPLRRPALADVEGQERAPAEAYLEQVAATLRTGGREVTTCAVAGPAAPAIAAVARDSDVDLIVMATHGRGGLARAVLGSVAAGTLHRTDRPLLLVRPAGLRRPVEEASGPVAGQEALPSPVARPAT
jgi:two-component system sensor histidine kinase UhpB